MFRRSNDTGSGASRGDRSGKAAQSADPAACFGCGQVGHIRAQCPKSSGTHRK